MSFSPSIRRPVATVALGAALVGASFTGVASAATIGKQTTLEPGATIPLDFAGYKEPSNDKVPSGYIIVKRTVTMQEGEIHLDGRPITAKLTAPSGYTLAALGDKGRIDWKPKPTRYAGKRSVTLTLTARSEDPGKQSATSTFYALAKRGNTGA